MRIGLAVCLISGALLTGAASAQPAAATARETGLTDAQIKRVRDGFESRVHAAFEALRGKPLKRAKKLPPLKKGRGNYVRGYSWSIVEFATRCFVLNEQVAEANAALIENAQHYLDNPKDITDRDSFYWHADVVCRLIEMYGAKGSVAPGRMTAEAEQRAMQPLWAWAIAESRIANANVAESKTWYVTESENHHLQQLTTAWHVARLASRSDEYKDRKYPDGSTPAEQLAAWNEYIKAYCLERAKKGLFIEMASGGYNSVALKGLYNVYDFTEDPEVKRRTGLLLDLCWATWAEEQIGGVRGGAKARVYQSGGDRLGVTPISRLAWFYFGIGKAPRFDSPMITAMLSSWRPAPVICDLALDIEGRGRYEIRERPMGLAEGKYWTPPNYRLRTDFGGILRYSWVTPAFIMGAPMLEPRPNSDWTMISSQNRWLGVIFEGDPDARIVPQVRAKDRRAAFNTQWAVQSKGTLICQKLKTCTDALEMSVWFSKAGLTNRVEENGWVFVEADKAFAAVRPAIGGATWDASGDKFAGDWLHCAEEWTPVILDVAEKRDFADYAAFRKTVAALPLSIAGGVLTCKGLSGDLFTFYTDQSKMPEVNGKPIDLAPELAFDSPFIKGKWDSGVVTVSKDGRKLVLDFNRP